MSHLDDDFAARAKRVRARTGDAPPMPVKARARRVRDDDRGEQAAVLAILRPQLALVLGAVALVAGRAVSMSHLGIEPSTDVLGLAEAGLVLILLFALGLLFGKSDFISHGALVVGAALSFLCEGYYILMAPELMSSIYDPEYVGRVLILGP